MRHFRTLTAVAVIGVTGLAGCASTETRTISSDPGYAYSDSRGGYNSTYSTNSRTYGVIEQIDYVKAGTTGAGAVIGGVIGGVLGHQIGSGRGNDAATVVGAVGGAVVGNEIEKNRNNRDVYRLRVRLDNGNTVTIAQDSIADLRAGDRVRVENDRAYRY